MDGALRPEHAGDDACCRDRSGWSAGCVDVAQLPLPSIRLNEIVIDPDLERRIRGEAIDRA